MPDSDGDGIGDACDPCTNTGAIFVTRGRLILKKLDTPPGDDRLRFKGELQLTYPFNPPLDPLTRGIRFLIHDALGTQVLDTTIPGGAFDLATQEGWSKRTDGNVFIYRHTGEIVPLIDGVKKVVIRNQSNRSPGLLKFVLVGRNGSYGVAPANIPIRVTVVIDPPVAMTGQCAEAVFPGPPPLVPTCTMAPDGSVLICR